MVIQDLQVYGVPNIYSIREPVVKIKLKLGELADVPTKDIKNLNQHIMEYFPGVADHKCARKYVGGFVDRLNEGTYLAHVTEHLCLELQRMLGHDIKFGKARQFQDDLYNVIFACSHPAIGRACGEFVVDTLNRFIDGDNKSFYERIEDLRKLCLRYSQGPSTGAIIQEARRRGIPVSEVGESGLIRLGYGKYQKYVSATLYENTSCIAADIACDKSLTKTVLQEVSIPVPKGMVCFSLRDAVSAAENLGYPVVVKPKSGNQGKQVFIKVSTIQELERTFSQAVTFDKEVMIEEQIKGNDYRLLVINGIFIAAAQRIPAHVIGDGIHTVKELVEIKNKDTIRGEDHEKPLTRLKIDDNTERILKKQGVGLLFVPAVDRIVWLRETANLSTGGDAYDCTDIVHPRNREIAELAAKSIGLDIAGIDMITPDISKPMENGFGAVVEVNAAPGIRMHLFPTEGKKRDVISPILDMIYPERSRSSIPIIAITGTNGKTTTTRIISRIFMEAGLKVGTTTTQGIYIDDRCIEEGDTTGPNSARRILNDRTVEAAVLETARGGIIREGLAYEKADVAVFTNLSEDHLGIDGINTMEDLLNAKSLVIEAVKKDGSCVLNADDPWVMKVKDRAKGNLILYSMDENNPHILEHMKSRGSCLYLKNDSICISAGGITRKLIPVHGIPATLGGALKHNIYNSMAAIGACWAAGLPFNIMKNVLSSFSCDVASNPGRFNIFDLKDFKVVLDYGHNIDGYAVTIEGLRKLNPSRLVGIIGVPGDRTDAHITKIAQISGKAFDSIIIKEDRDLRGRKPLEVANIMLESAVEIGVTRDKIKIIEEEEAALQHALSQAQKGDIIAVFFEKMEPLIEIIQNSQ